MSKCGRGNKFPCAEPIMASVDSPGPLWGRKEPHAPQQGLHMVLPSKKDGVEKRKKQCYSEENC